jgi:hypothetical protein
VSGALQYEERGLGELGRTQVRVGDALVWNAVSCHGSVRPPQTAHTSARRVEARKLGAKLRENG